MSLNVWRVRIGRFVCSSVHNKVRLPLDSHGNVNIVYALISDQVAVYYEEFGHALQISNDKWLCECGFAILVINQWMESYCIPVLCKR